jgi:predicted nucleic acid-binding protein
VLSEQLHAPHLIDIEVAHALRRLLLLGRITEPQATAALIAFVELPLTRHPHLPLLSKVWRLRNNRSAYDATYVALAEALSAPLITLDARLARTSAAVPIEVF